MKVRIIIGPSATYAQIVDRTRSLDVLLHDQKLALSNADSLRARAIEMREQAQRLQKRAWLCEQAAAVL